MDPAPEAHVGGWRLSLRWKLTLWMLVITLVLQLTLALIVLMYQRSSIGQFFNERALTRAETIGAAVRRANFIVTDDDLRRIANESLRFVMDERFVVTLYSGDGTVVASTMDPAPPAREVGLERARRGAAPLVVRQYFPGLDEEGEDHPASRVVLRRLGSRDGAEFVLLVATTDRYFEAMTGLTLRVLALSLTIGGVAASVAAWLIAGLATAPLRELRRIAGSLAPEVIEQQEMAPLPSSTETAAVEKELRDVRAKLLQALHAQDRFVSSASHELKTPIAVLLTEAQTLQSAQLPEHARQFVRSVIEEMRRLSRMIESFLTLTRLRGGGEAHLKIMRCGVNDFVVEAAQNCDKLARQHKVTLALELSDHDPPLSVAGDAGLLRVMLDNLITNAIRFSLEQQQVVIKVACNDAGCQVIIRDFGPGVPEELMDKLFDQFVQAPSEVSRGRGHGLGLSIAQGIAELHGGRITVRNVPEGGCEFTVHLPLAVVDLKEAGPLPDQPPRPASAEASGVRREK